MPRNHHPGVARRSSIRKRCARDLRQFGEHLLERLHLNMIEDTAGDVRVAGHKIPHGFAGLRFDDDQAAAAISEWPGEHDLACLREGFEMAQVRGALLWALLLRIRRVVSNDDEERTVLLNALKISPKLVAYGCDDTQAYVGDSGRVGRRDRAY